MSWYTDESIIKAALKNKAWWTTTFSPGEKVPRSGIYRCLGCGREDCCNENDPFPTQSHHQHTPSQGKIVWKLNVAAAGDGHS